MALEVRRDKLGAAIPGQVRRERTPIVLDVHAQRHATDFPAAAANPAAEVVKGGPAPHARLTPAHELSGLPDGQCFAPVIWNQYQRAAHTGSRSGQSWDRIHAERLLLEPWQVLSSQLRVRTQSPCQGLTWSECSIACSESSSTVSQRRQLASGGGARGTVRVRGCRE